MNSLVQEAPSISKAIELAWTKAGEPQKFSIRIYEFPEKNFFGMVKKQAKIALLFEKRDIRTKAPQKQQPQRPQQKRSQEKDRRPAQKPQQRKEKPTQKPSVEPKPKKQKQEAEKKEKREIWSEQMVEVGTNWMKGMLKTLGKGNIKFSVQAKRYHLKFMIESPISETEEKQKMIFRNCAHLLMQTVRNRFKKQFRYHKVVISSNKG